MSVTIALANQKGGVGKTTSTIELAACFTNRGYKTLVVDLEQQMDTTKYSGGDPFKPGSYKVLKEEINIEDAIQQTPEFDILAATPELSKADDEFTKPTDVLKLRKALQSIDDSYDFIVIDTNPGRNRLLNMAYIAADYVIIPTDADDGSVSGIISIFDDLNEYKEAKWTNADVLGIILTRFENTSMHKYQQDVIKELIAVKQPDAFFMTVRKAIAASECKTERTSLQKGKKNSKPAIDYRRIADTIIDRLTED
ncbi:MAG: ParA family protein [Lachnospiraceae bacterium]|nr:ParA family protein [Lachnospiraceae bacterium]